MNRKEYLEEREIFAQYSRGEGATYQRMEDIGGSSKQAWSEFLGRRPHLKPFYPQCFLCDRFDGTYQVEDKTYCTPCSKAVKRYLKAKEDYKNRELTNKEKYTREWNRRNKK